MRQIPSCRALFNLKAPEIFRYLKCLAEEDVSDLLVYTRQSQDVSKKAHVVINMFDFIANAKSIRLCHTDGTPEAAMFKVGAGSNNGVIGYSNEDR